MAHQKQKRRQNKSRKIGEGAEPDYRPAVLTAPYVGGLTLRWLQCFWEKDLHDWDRADTWLKSASGIYLLLSINDASLIDKTRESTCGPGDPEIKVVSARLVGESKAEAFAEAEPVHKHY